MNKEKLPPGIVAICYSSGGNPTRVVNLNKNAINGLLIDVKAGTWVYKNPSNSSSKPASLKINTADPGMSNKTSGVIAVYDLLNEDGTLNTERLSSMMCIPGIISLDNNASGE